MLGFIREDRSFFVIANQEYFQSGVERCKVTTESLQHRNPCLGCRSLKQCWKRINQARVGGKKGRYLSSLTFNLTSRKRAISVTSCHIFCY